MYRETQWDPYLLFYYGYSMVIIWVHNTKALYHEKNLNNNQSEIILLWLFSLPRHAKRVIPCQVVFWPCGHQLWFKQLFDFMIWGGGISDVNFSSSQKPFFPREWPLKFFFSIFSAPPPPPRRSLMVVPLVATMMNINFLPQNNDLSAPSLTSCL